MTITLLDGILIGIMLVSAILAMVRGFSREVLSVVSWLAAAAAAFFFYKPLTPYVQQYIHNEKIAMGAAALAIFVITLIIVSFITLRIADFIIDSRIGALDRILGFIFGAARGLLLVVVAMLFFNWLAPENQPGWVANARSKPLLDDLGQRLVAALPENAEETLLNKVRGLHDGNSGEPAAKEASPGEPSTVEGVINNNNSSNPPDDAAPPQN